MLYLGASGGGREAGGREARGHLHRTLSLLRIQLAVLPENRRPRALLPRVAALLGLFLEAGRTDRHENFFHSNIKRMINDK